MLLLAGLLGLVAVSSIIVVMYLAEKSDSSDASSDAEATDQKTDSQDNDLSRRGIDKALVDDDSSGENCDETSNEIADPVPSVQEELTVPDKMPELALVNDEAPEGPAATVMDYDTDEDSLVLVWDDDADQNPEVSVVEDERNPDLAHVMLNGRVLADINGGRNLTASDIILVPQSTAFAASAHPTIAALLSPA